MTYPPSIAHNAFADAPPPPLALVASCPLTATQCSLIAFGLVANNHTTVPGDASHAGAHGALAAAHGTRVRIAPGIDQLFFAWSLAGHAQIDGAIIEIFRANDPNALWTKTIAWGNPAGRSAQGWSAFRGFLGNDDAANAATGATYVATADGTQAAEFPTTFLTAEHAPYKVRMTIHAVGNSIVETQVRWFYLDVVVAAIELALGAEAIVPQGGNAADYGYNRRNRRLRAAIGAALHNAPSLIDADNAAISVPLDGNIFTIDVAGHDDEMRDNAAFAAWTAQWRTGPLLPIVATPKVRRFAGNTVFSPHALGAGRLLWDWEGSDLDVDALVPLARDGVQAAYLVNLHEWPTGRQNTMTARGGKRGGVAQIVKTDDVGYQTYADGGQGDFPYRMDACAARHGAAFSRSGTTANTRGRSGALFSPSIIARDQFRLRCYFAYGAQNQWDVDSTAEHLRTHLPVDVPYATTGSFAVKRVVRVQRHYTTYRGDMAGAAFDWERLANHYFAPAGIELDTSQVAGNPTSLDQAEYRAGFAAALAGLSPRAQFAVRPQGDQAVGTFGIRFRERNELPALVNQEFAAALAAIGASALGQINGAPGILDRIQARVDLYCRYVRHAPQNRGATPAAAACVVDEFNQVVRPINLAIVPNVDEFATPFFAQALDTRHHAGVDVELAAMQTLLTNPTPAGDQAAMAFVLRAAGLDVDESYFRQTTEWARVLVDGVCNHVNDQHLHGDEAGDGVQVYQFDFLDNLDGFNASGEAITTASNRTRCPECNAVLADAERRARACNACNALLRTNAAVRTEVPWRLMRARDFGVAWNLRQNRDKYVFLSSMEGTCPEILVAHEIGHHLFLPHSNYGFIPPDLVPHSGIWFFLRAKFLFGGLNTFLQTLQQNTTPGGHKAAYHATDHHACIMGYNFVEMSRLHFCWKCLLRLRGWDGAVVETL